MPIRNVIAALALALGLGFQPTWAQDTVPAEPVDPWAACVDVAVDPYEVANRLTNFEDVFGKNAIEWGPDDYEQLLDLAFACNGAAATDGFVVKADDWHEAIEDAKEEVYPVAGVHQEIMRLARALGSDGVKLPICQAFLAYKHDDKEMTDNSAALFGLSLMTLTDADIERVIAHTNNCLAFLPEFALRHLGTTQKRATLTLYAVMDRALYIKGRREDWKFWKDKKTTDVLVKIDGTLILPTFTSPKTKQLITRYNRAASFPGGLSLETISALISISDDILDESKSVYDVAYATEVKRLVQKGIFDRTEAKLE